MSCLEVIKQIEYDELYDRIVKVLEGYDFCQFDKDGLCSNYRDSKKYGLYVDPCCCCGSSSYNVVTVDGITRCKHYVIGKGCSTKSIACKLWFCNHLNNKIPEYIKVKLNGLRIEALSKGFYCAREGFEECLKHGFTNT